MVFGEEQWNFALQHASADGTDVRTIITSAWQQMTHARVSPNGQWVLYSRYTRIGKNGFAEESPENYWKDGENYLGTEICLFRLDGSDNKTLVSAERDEANVNCSWVNDNEMIFIHADSGGPKLIRAELEPTMKIKRTEIVPVPKELMPTDPHQQGDMIAFGGIGANGKRSIWVYSCRSGTSVQVTKPAADLGDTDPMISPDGTKISYMRNIKGKYTWHAYIVDIATATETDLSERRIHPIFEADGVPRWSSDGARLVIWHPKAASIPPAMDIYIIGAVDQSRERIGLPAGLHYQHPSLFRANAGSGGERVIFSAMVPVRKKK